jgi:hypothetical protein
MLNQNLGSSAIDPILQRRFGSIGSPGQLENALMSLQRASGGAMRWGSPGSQEGIPFVRMGQVRLAGPQGEQVRVADLINRLRSRGSPPLPR